MTPSCAPEGWPELDGGFTILVWVGGTYTTDFPAVEVCLVPVKNPLTDNIAHIRGFPLALEGTNTIRAKDSPLAIEGARGLPIDL